LRGVTSSGNLETLAQLIQLRQSKFGELAKRKPEKS